MKGIHDQLDLAELSPDRLPAETLHALLEFALRKMEQRDQGFAIALAREVVSLGKMYSALPSDRGGGFGWGVRTLDRDEWLAECLRNGLKRRLMRKADDFGLLQVKYNQVFSLLQRIPKARWSSFTQRYWRTLGRSGKIPADTQEALRTNLKHARTPRGATLEILAQVFHREPDSLTKRFRRAKVPARSRR